MKSFFTLRFCVLASTLMLFSLLSANAQQAKKISMQGFLKDANGKAVADGQQEITFKLYNVPVGGTAEWTDTQNINIFGGVYSTHLGSTTNPLDNLNWGSKTYYVGVTVQGTELTPRTELTFAPYSLGSPSAERANTVVCSGAVGDVKYSILNPTQFAAKNGSCWVPMDGRSIVGSELAATTGMTTLPNGGGLFIRSQEFSNSSNHDPNRDSSSPIAQYEEQAMQTHQHYASLSISGGTSAAGNHNHSVSIPGREEEGGFIDVGKSFVSFSGTDRSIEFYHNAVSTSSGDHTHSISGSAAGWSNDNNGYTSPETRPKNINFWVYIRIN